MTLPYGTPRKQSERPLERRRRRRCRRRCFVWPMGREKSREL